MARIRVLYHYTGAALVSGHPVQVTPTQGITVDAATTTQGGESRPTAAQIQTALTAAGVAATAYGGLTLKVEGYSSAD